MNKLSLIKSTNI